MCKCLLGPLTITIEWHKTTDISRWLYAPESCSYLLYKSADYFISLTKQMQPAK